MMPLVNQCLRALSKLELVISWHLVVGDEGDVAHDFTDLRELEILDVHLVVCFDGGEELVIGGHVLQEPVQIRVRLQGGKACGLTVGSGTDLQRKAFWSLCLHPRTLTASGSLAEDRKMSQSGWDTKKTKLG